MVGHLPLEEVILVRVQVPQPRNVMTKARDLDSNRGPQGAKSDCRF